MKHLLVLMLLVLPITAGCAGHHQRTAHGTKLSEAMQKASDDHEGGCDIDTGGSEPVWTQYDPSQSIATHDNSPSELSKTDSKKQNYRNVVSAAIGSGMITGDEFYRLNHADLSYGFHLDEKKRLEGFIGLGHVLIEETAELSASIDDAWMGTIGFRVKHFSTPDHTFMGHYFTLGLGIGFMLV